MAHIIVLIICVVVSVVAHNLKKADCVGSQCAQVLEVVEEVAEEVVEAEAGSMFHVEHSSVHEIMEKIEQRTEGAA